MEILRPSSGDEVAHSLHSLQSIKVEPQVPPRLEWDDLYGILQITPNDSLIAMELARRMVAAGRLSEAHRVLRNVVKIDSRFESIHQLGQVEYQIDQLDESMRHLHEAMMIAGQTRPEFFEIFKTLGNIHVRKGDLDAAEENYNKAHRLNESSDTLWVNLGTLMIQRQSWAEAVERFRKAVTLNPKNDKAWVGLALGHRMMGDLELAWGNLEAAVEHGPLNEVALGLALDWGAQEGREFRVLEMIRGYLTLGGWSERLSLAFAWLSWRRGDRMVARLELERLTSVNPRNMRALEMIEEMRSAV